METLLSSNVGICIYSAIWSIIGGIAILVVYSIRKRSKSKKIEYHLTQDEMNDIEMRWYNAGWRDGWQLNKNVYKLKKKGEVK